MTDKLKNLLLTLLTFLLLWGVALAVPLGSLTPEAQRSYVDEGPASVDDEYAFLYED